MRKSFTYQNHLQYGYGASMEEYDPLREYFIQVGAAGRSLMSPMAEAIHAAKLIDQSTDKRIALLVSSGCDSMCMLEAFSRAGVKFEAAIMRFRPALNFSDIRDVIRYCYKLNIPFEIHDLDIWPFFESGEYISYSGVYRSGLPELAAHLWLIDRIKGFPVLAGNPPWYRYDDGRFKLVLPTDIFMCFHRLLEGTNRDGVGHFFLYTPELVHSFLSLPSTQNHLHKLSKRGSLGFDYEFKRALYRESGFSVPLSPIKRHGFEGVWKHYRSRTGGGDFHADFCTKMIEAGYPACKEELTLV